MQKTFTVYALVLMLIIGIKSVFYAENQIVDFVLCLQGH